MEIHLFMMHGSYGSRMEYAYLLVDGQGNFGSVSDSQQQCVIQSQNA
jgi:hypothetical protein